MKCEIDLNASGKGAIKLDDVNIADCVSSFSVGGSAGVLTTIRLNMMATHGVSVSANSGVMIDSIKLPHGMTREAIDALKAAITGWELANS